MKNKLFPLLALLSICAAEQVNSQPGVINNAPGQLKNPIVKIGGKFWMQKNLDVSTYRDGTKIPEVTDRVMWAKLTSGAYCYYNNDSVKYAALYGKLYNWYAVNSSRGLAPAGWHIPSDSEWLLLTAIVSGYSKMAPDIAGGFLKEGGTTHWSSPNAGATNLSGFTGLPGGYRLFNGYFEAIHGAGMFWSSTSINAGVARYRGLFFDKTWIYNFVANLHEGYSVRCIKN